MQSPEFTFRPLEKPDFELVASWIGRPHVQRWWREPATVEAIAREYGAFTEGDLQTRVYIVETAGRSIGMIQCYRTDDYPADTRDWDAAGLIGMDYLIGEEELIGRGLGSAMISAFVEQVVRGVYSDARGVVADPEVANLASIGALRRAGFREHKVLPTGEYGTPEQLMVKVYDETPG